jgi:hypothetical protein
MRVPAAMTVPAAMPDAKTGTLTISQAEENVVLSMDLDAGTATEAKLLHSRNALSPMVCNASGKATEAKLRHPHGMPQLNSNLGYRYIA